MSLLELIAQRAPPVADGLQLSDFLAETALVALAEGHDVKSRPLIARHFARVLMEDSALNADILVGNLLEQGVPLDRIISQYIPEVARLLGKQWEDDEISFSQVTHACGHLLKLLHDLGSPRPLHRVPALDRPRALLLRPDAETHFLGLMIVASQLRQEGWLIKLDLTGDIDKIAQTLKTDTFDFVGITLGTKRASHSAEALIRRVRGAVPKARIALGGKINETEPGLSRELGVDIAIRQSEKIADQLSEHMQIGAV